MTADEFQHDPNAEQYIEICPGCASHLEDTWSGEACTHCGFSYIHEETTGRARRPSLSTSPILQALAVAATLVGVTLIIGTMVSLYPTEQFASEQGQALVLHREGMLDLFAAGVGSGFGAVLCYLGGALGGGR